MEAIFVCSRNGLSTAGTRTIILTVVIAGLAAYFFPHKEAQ